MLAFHGREGAYIALTSLLYRQKKRRREGNGCGAYRDGVRNTASAQCPETIAGKIV